MTRWKLVAAMAAVAALIVASLVVLLIGSGRQSAEPSPVPTPPIRIDPQTTAHPTVTPAPSGGAENQPMPGDQANQVAVANAYLDAFLQPGTPAEREARLKEWATPSDLVVAKLVANERLPKARRKGSAALDPAVARANQAYAHIQLTDDSWWGVGLVKDLTAPKGWRVSFVEKEGH